MRGAPLFAVLLCGLVAAQGPELEMTTYQLVLLRRGPNPSPLGEREIQSLQERHLAHLDRLLGEGKLVIEGPLDGGGELRSVVVLDAGSVENAAALMAQDAWVESGQLAAEIHPWWTAKGIIKRPESLSHNARFWFALVKRPQDAPAYSDEKLQEIQAGHMANIGKMSEAGALVLAGPVGDDGALRGIFVFRNQDSGRIVELFEGDPARLAGRLEMELYPWHVPAGSLPD